MSSLLRSDWKIMALNDVCFQQDYIVYHTINEIMLLVWKNFPGFAVLKRDYVNRSPRSCDLTSLKFLPLGCVKG